MVDDPHKPSSDRQTIAVASDDATVFKSAPPEREPGDGATFRPGALLSHTYQIERLLARGGMGEVYRARHVELGTWHAVKIILPELAENPKIADLFRREGGVLRNLRSDAVVGYDGVFRDENGRVYLVMEFVEGLSLSDILAERRLTPNEVRALRDRVAAGLAAAHEIGVVHRDMSPDNIILPGGQIEAAKIIDFGIAKLADPEQKTILGEDFAGKYSYVSPEQLGLFGGGVDARSDIYSLGLILAAAAIGRPLDMGNSMASVIDARKAVPDLSEVPDELLDDLVAMLQPDPALRPQSMSEVIGAGSEPAPGAANASERASAPTSPAAGRAPSPAKGGPPVALVAGSAIGVLAALVIGGYVMFGPSGDESPQVARQLAAPGETAGGLAPPSKAPSPPAGPPAVNPPPQVPATPAPARLDAPPTPTSEPAAAVPQAARNRPMDAATPDPGASQEPSLPPAEPGRTRPQQAAIDSAPAPEPPAPAPKHASEPPSPEPTAKTTVEPPVTTALITPPPAPERAVRDRAVDRIMSDVKCGHVGGDIAADGRVHLVGHVPSDIERQVLRALLIGVTGVSEVSDGGLVVLPEPNCRIVEAMPATGLSLAADQRASAPPLGQPVQSGTLTFRAGELLTIDLDAPSQPTYYYVDYYDNANNVIHLLPSPVAPANHLQANKRIRLGGTERYAISPPFGLELVVALGVSVPLFDRPRPEVELADVYLADLRRAIAAARGKSRSFNGEYSYLIVETKP